MSDLEKLVLARLENPSEINPMIDKKIKAFSGLLTKEAALNLIAKELGIKLEKNYFLKDIPKGEKNFGFIAKIKKVWPVAEYKSGKKSLTLDVEDNTSSHKIILWNKDVEMANTLRSNDLISVKGAYEKSGELFLGFSGSLEIQEKSKPSILSELTEGQEYHIRGFVKDIDSDLGNKIFYLTDEVTILVCSFAPTDSRFEKIAIGEEIFVEDVVFKNGQINILPSSKIKIRKSQNLSSLVTSLEIVNEPNEEKLLVRIGEKEFLLNRDQALKFFEIDLSSDLALSTIIKLKSEIYLGKRTNFQFTNST